MNKPLAQRNAHILKCDIYRRGATVSRTSDKTVVFSGSAELTQNQRDNGAKGINAAKRYVRGSGQRSYTVI